MHWPLFWQGLELHGDSNSSQFFPLKRDRKWSWMAYDGNGSIRKNLIFFKKETSCEKIKRTKSEIRFFVPIFWNGDGWTCGMRTYGRICKQPEMKNIAKMPWDGRTDIRTDRPYFRKKKPNVTLTWIWILEDRGIDIRCQKRSIFRRFCKDLPHRGLELGGCNLFHCNREQGKLAIWHYFRNASYFEPARRTCLKRTLSKYTL